MALRRDFSFFTFGVVLLLFDFCHFDKFDKFDMPAKSKKAPSGRRESSALTSVPSLGDVVEVATPVGSTVEASRSKVDRDEWFKRLLEHGDELKGDGRFALLRCRCLLIAKIGAGGV